MTAPWIDLNADLGEGCADDESLLAVVTSASIACGVHAGDAPTMAATVTAAARRGVTVGAHPSYEDRPGFGRRHLDVAPATLTAGLVAQIRALRVVADGAGTAVTYVKPHGALYGDMATDASTAEAVLDALAAFGDLVLLAPAQSLATALAADRAMPVVAEAFADRAYAPDGSLVPRSAPGALIEDPDLAAEQAVRIATEGRIVTADGSSLALEARSICVHGDAPGAAVRARRVRRALEAAGVTVRRFAP